MSAAMLAPLFWVALGSTVGGALRFLVSGLVARTVGETFPWGTLVVNATGALAIGVAAAAFPPGTSPDAWALLVTGVLGSYTTVSSFSLQTLALLREGSLVSVAGNVIGSLVLCLGGAAIGFASMAALLGRPA
ncbi:fluoride efflux transporter CrcB [Elioraea sp. Yellowstone]|jgi:CrcB protein|uniref:fluoride efflux transporter CrcB n=1 Tax=Elioraea sp. Yellowstone TaxID=2592070 RepID=UPI001F15BA97|nr:fluoride efflux transporter CrcB [Elioraea sp. Yellowstone]